MPAPRANLASWLAERFEGDFISLHDYMNTCLYHPVEGYYTQGKNFGPEQGRDFVTAPLLTPLFAACVARWVENAYKKIGAPEKFVLAEAGPGDGKLMKSVLNGLDDNIRDACEVMLVETSPALTALQRKNLGGVDARWKEKITAQKHRLILFANEVLDAFPVHQFENKNGAWVERGFDRALNPATRLAPPLPGPREEGVYETSPEQDAWLQEVKQHCAAALLVDYGYTGGHGDSAQALHAHQMVPLTHRPGEADLTAHVNFAHVAGTLGPGCAVGDLAPFLLKTGILAAAEPRINNPEVAAALHRLLHPTRMGALFKVAEYFA